ncbi:MULTISPECIES: NAD(P)/FAD-dependent oxidoreductase [unclassified Halomonas]|uniref:NAD(P)/FAD-dependent oxidoreductase n=1 Tax=unclassified Halomonas TaxID=2609666 RepID=UPI001CF1405A|nr:MULTISPECIES: FAD-dependent oxidoreductase [unclassified Halomonas]MCA8865951.1 amine oxidase [Halomonas sp. SBBP1]UZH10305.1 FAD-dependent oxidoreductase [Halomonas sp. BDJS001]
MTKPLPPLPDHHSVAIIGAGIAGLACGQVLASSGASVTLFDKARGPGGRMSSKRRSVAVVDVGAQAFSVRDAAFQHAVDEWLEAGCIAAWPTCTYQASSRGWQAHDDGQKRYTGAPRMSALTRYMADSLTAMPNAELHTGTPIVALEQPPNGWLLLAADETHHGPYDQIVISAPPPQAHALVKPWDNALAAVCTTREQRACWAGWALFDGPLPALTGVNPGWQMARLDLPMLNIVSRNQTKPGRETQSESVSLLAQLDWSEAHLEQPAEWVAEQLLTAFKRTFPPAATFPKLIETGAHRWRYAQPTTPCEYDYLYSANGLALCGDSFRGGRVEDAWLSGHRLGEALIGRSVR